MNNPSVRNTKLASELESGDWIAKPPLACRDWFDEPLVRVRYATPVQGGRIVQVLIDVDDDCETARYNADEQVPVATEAEIAEAAERAERHRLAYELHQLADLIVDRKLPLPQFSLSVHASLKTRADVRAVAEALGLEVRDRSVGAEVSWPQGRGSHERGVYAEFYTTCDDPEPDPSGLDYSREPDEPTGDPVPDGVEGAALTGRAS